MYKFEMANSPVKKQRPLLIFSPLAASVVSILIALIALVTPPGMYSALLDERNLVFLSPDVFLFVMLCFLGFIVGYLIGNSAPKRTEIDQAGLLSEGHQLLRSVRVVSGVSIVLTMANVYLLTRLISGFSVGTMVRLLGETEELRVAVLGSMKSLSGFRWILGMTSTATCWGLWTYYQCRGRVRTRVQRVLGLLVFLAGSSSALVVFVTQKRTPLLSFAAGLVLTYFLNKYRESGISLRKIVLTSTLFILLAVGYFGVSQSIRTGDSVGDTQAYAVGYFVGSYNRLAAIMDGSLYMGSPGGYYWTEWIWQAPFLQGWSGIEEAAERLFGDTPTVGAAERTDDIWRAGLRRNFTAVTAFGQSYVDFGWFGFLPFIPYGFLSGALWRLFKRHNFWGIVLYPTVFWSLIDWRGLLGITRSTVWQVLFIAIVLWFFIYRPSRPVSDS